MAVLYPRELARVTVAVWTPKAPPKEPPPPRPMRFERFESAEFKVNVAKLHKVWNITRKSDGAVTMWESGAEGAERYRRLKRMWASDRKRFNKVCSLYQYYDETGKEIE